MPSYSVVQYIGELCKRAQLTFHFPFVNGPGLREGDSPLCIGPLGEGHGKLPHFVDDELLRNSIVWLIEPKPQIMTGTSLVYTRRH